MTMLPQPAVPAGPHLRDIHLPPPPPWWPPAPGWWLLAGLILLLVFIGIWCWRRHRRAQHRRQQVLRELDRIAMNHRQDGDPAALATDMQQLLRRVARQHVPPAAMQRGEAWRQTLARMPISAVQLDRLLALDQHIYRRHAQAAFDVAAAVAAAREWLSLASKPARWKHAAQQPISKEATDA